MPAASDPTQIAATSRDEYVRHVLEDCQRRRSAGEALSDESVIASYPDLMPTLAHELRRLHVSVPADVQQTITSTGLGSSAAMALTENVLPESIPGYDIVKEIHRGGQGVVFQAIQKSTRRRVAIKALHGGAFADDRARARIEREVQILGQIEHPNVVGVHDSGSVAGCLYYTMDYIAGQPLDRFVSEHKLALEQTLRLFARVCEAVNAAHLRGVIHRDLKPANILVDPGGEPHVLDFGLAKLAADAGGSSADGNHLSMTGQFLGSVPWASPEQAEGIPNRIDTRTDVYSLGVILYQLLTGKFPYEVTGKVPEVLQRIIQQEPARPSTIGRRLNDELDTIVLKCLAKDPDRRYQTAGEVARDVRHYLASEPIEAKRDSTLYVLSKTLRRHRLPVAIGATFIVLLAVFAVVITFMWHEVRQEARRTALVADFLDGVLLNVDPEQAQASLDTPLYAAQLETVENAARQAATLSAEPEVEARVRNTIGRLFMNLGRYQDARAQLAPAVQLRTAAYGEQNADTAESMLYLAWAQKELGDFEHAEALDTRVLNIRRGLFGDAHASVAEALNNFGQLYYAQRKLDRAEELLRDALSLRQQDGTSDKEIATAQANLGSVLRDAGRLDEAERLLRDALDLRVRVLGERHFHTVVSMNKLGLLLRDRGQFGEARALLEQTLTLRRQVLPDSHPHIAVSLANLGMTLNDLHDYRAAVPYLSDALHRFERDPQANLYRIYRTLSELVAALRALNNPAAAEEQAKRVAGMLPTDSREGRIYQMRALVLLADLQLQRVAAQGGEPALAEQERTLRDLLNQVQSDGNMDADIAAQIEGLLQTCLAAQQHLP